MKAEIIAVGTELLLGEITDTNATHISQRLAAIGVDLHYRHTVGDNLDRLVGVIETAMGRSEAIIICGGLGPTEDDLTREAIARAVHRPLVRDPRAVRCLKAFFSSLGLPTSMAELGGRDEDIDFLIENISYDSEGMLGSFVRLDPLAIREIYDLM